MKPTVLLVDDDSDVRAFLTLLLQSDGTFEVVGAAPDGAAGISVAAHVHPDLVVLDLSMPVMDGMTALREIRRVSPESSVVVLSAFGTDRTVTAAMRAGAVGFLHKGANMAQGLVPALVRALDPDGDRVIDLGTPEHTSELSPERP
jgi:DNA-binding NarL/FixJ family response regulator